MSAFIYKITFLFITFLVVTELKAQFMDATAQQLGIENFNEGEIYGDGVSFYDFTGDGWDDLTIGNGSEMPYFFMNDHGQFQQIDLGISNDNSALVLMTLWADYDQDGDNDLLITRDNAPLQLWQNNGELEFIDVASTVGFDMASYHYWGAAFDDYDHDGCLDLVVAKYYHPAAFPGPQYRSVLYHNNCDGTFTNVSLEAGFDLPPRTCFQPVFVDYNNDGWEDLFLVIDRIQFRNEMFRNNGDGTFTNVSVETGIDYSICAMSGTIEDFNNDLYDDIYVSNGVNGNLLMVNHDGVSFSNEADSMGIAMNQVCWSGLWIDYDNNSWQDLMIAVTSPYLEPLGNQLFQNNEGVDFTNITEISGLQNDTSQTHMMAIGDCNNDGYFDVVMNNEEEFMSRLWLNDGGDNNYISVELKGVYSNTNGIGSRIHCYAGGEHYVRYTRCGESFTAQNSGKEIFGIGNTAVVDSIVVEWNRGEVTAVRQLLANQQVRIVEGTEYNSPAIYNMSEYNIVCDSSYIILDASEYEAYSWNTGDTTRFITVSNPGVYSVITRNAANMLMFSDSITLIDGMIGIPEFELTTPLCFGDSSGSVQISLNGTAPDNVLWSNGLVGDYIDHMSSGSYQYSFYNEMGCEVSGEVYLQQPELLAASVPDVQLNCSGDSNGIAELVVSGGTSPFTADWNGIDPYALSSGQFEVTLVDDNGCSAHAMFQVLEPEPLVAEFTSGDAIENGSLGWALILPDGGTAPYSIQWSNGVEDMFSVGELSAGNYSVMITDANGCSYEMNFVIELLENLYELEKSGICFFPNPTASVVSFSETVADIRLVDISGHLVLQATNSSLVDVSKLDSGVYFLLYTDQNGFAGAGKLYKE